MTEDIHSKIETINNIQPKNIKHLSFDLWLTLIKSHPEFKEKKAKLIKETFSIDEYSVQSIKEIFRNIAKSTDHISEQT